MTTAARTRADAVRNHERVLAAAVEVLVEKGPDAGIPEIAARAGVGKGTVYRCFETKEHLVAAVLTERVRGWTALVAEAADRPDAWEAFSELLGDLAVRQAKDCTFSHVSQHAAMAEARREMYAQFDRLMARAKEQGRMRPDVTSEDVRVLFAGTVRGLRAGGERDPDEWRRYGELLADAFRQNG